MTPRWAQDGTKTVKEAMLNQVGFRKASERESIEKTKENEGFFVCRSVAFGRPRRPEDAPRRPQDAPRRSQDAPRWLQDAPRCAQDGTRTVKEAMLSQVGVRKASDRESVEEPTEKQCFLVWCSVAFGRPRRPEDTPRRPQDAPRRSQDAPRGGQDSPKWSQDAPKTAPGR